MLHRPHTGFSTLYRVDAIEGPTSLPRPDFDQSCFSTLYRVDAIEGSHYMWQHEPCFFVSVPSIGSMLLKASLLDARQPGCFRFSTLYRVDAIEGFP